MNRHLLAFASLLLACDPQAAESQADPDTPVMSPRVVTAEPVSQEVSEPSTMSAAAPVEHLDLVVEDGPLTEQLTVQAGKAIRAGKRPFVEMRAGWCPVCKRVDKHLLSRTMGEDLSDVVLIRIDTDVFGPELAPAGLTSKTIPALYELDRRGKPTDHWVNGHRWGARADIPAKLRAFFAAS